MQGQIQVEKPQVEKAFQDLKTAFTMAPILVHRDFAQELKNAGMERFMRGQGKHNKDFLHLVHQLQVLLMSWVEIEPQARLMMHTIRNNHLGLTLMLGY
jgi:hypothetical protein